jgi:hypothetical protein
MVRFFDTSLATFRRHRRGPGPAASGR